jgi:hypothetical protein
MVLLLQGCGRAFTPATGTEVETSEGNAHHTIPLNILWLKKSLGSRGSCHVRCGQTVLNRLDLLFLDDEKADAVSQGRDDPGNRIGGIKVGH